MDTVSKNAPVGRTMASGASRWWRVGLYLIALVLVGSVVSTRSLAAELGERGLLFGQQLGAWQVFSGRSTDVVFNGQPLSLHTSTQKRPVGEVLRDFVKVCGTGSERAAVELADTLSAGAAADLDAIQRMFVMRDQRGDAEGTAMCFAGLGAGGLSGVASRFGRFAQRLDVSELGALRYLYVRKVESGSHVILVTAPGSLVLSRLMPADGKDAEGVEPVPGIRPRDAVRFISARLAEANHGFTAYRVANASAPEVLQEYAEQVRAAGYEVVDLPQLSGEALSARGAPFELRVLRRGERTLIATSAPRGPDSWLSVVEL